MHTLGRVLFVIGLIAAAIGLAADIIELVAGRRPRQTYDARHRRRTQGRGGH